MLGVSALTLMKKGMTLEAIAAVKRLTVLAPTPTETACVPQCGWRGDLWWTLTKKGV